jgi:hypothetical protein
VHLALAIMVDRLIAAPLLRAGTQQGRQKACQEESWVCGRTADTPPSTLQHNSAVAAYTIFKKCSSKVHLKAFCSSSGLL